MPNTPVVTADPARRALRTLFQIGTVTALIALWNAFAATPLTAGQTSAITAVGTLLVSFAQNFLEEQGAVPKMFKGPTPDPALPAVVGDGPSNATIQRELLELATYLKNFHADVTSELHDLKTRQPNDVPTTPLTGGAIG